MNNQYPMMSEYQYPIIIGGGSGGQDFKKVTTTTQKSTKPIVVTREDLVTALAGASDEYKKALEESNTLMGALGKSVSDEQVAKILAAPTNKGRLESKMGWGQALSGALMSGLNTYGKLNQIKENKAAKEYEDALKMATMTDTLRAREEAADLQNAVNNQTVTVTGMEKYNLPKDGNSSQQTLQQQVNDKVDRESAAITAADVWNTVNQHPNQFSQLAYYTYGAFPGDDAKRRGWVSQQAPLVGGVELQKLQRMMPKGFSGAINSAHEQKLMMPVREALTSGIGSKIKPAIETYLGGYYDELQKEFMMKTGGEKLPFTKEDFISDQLTNNAREYNTDFDPSNPNTPMFLPIKGVNNTKPVSAEDLAKMYGGTVIQQ